MRCKPIEHRPSPWAIFSFKNKGFRPMSLQRKIFISILEVCPERSAASSLEEK
jgi:hypothetical protein